MKNAGKNYIIKEKKTAALSLANVNLSDRFLFSNVMEDEAFAAGFLQILLPDLKIGQIQRVESEKTIEHTYYGRGIRLDIYLLDTQSRRFNLEMQNENADSLPKRSRFYQSSSDVEFLKRGQRFSTLPASYVIFICSFDLFHEGRCLYSFQNRCEENGDLLLGDGTYKIFVNCKGWRSTENLALRGFLRYLDCSTAQVADEYDSPYMRKLHERVSEIKGDEKMSMAYTIWKLHQEDARIEGEKRGEKRGEIRMAMLVQRLMAEERSDELARAMTDPGFRHKLFREYDIH